MLFGQQTKYSVAKERIAMSEDTKQCLSVCAVIIWAIYMFISGIGYWNRLSNEYWQPIALESIKNGGTMIENRCLWGRK